MASLLPAREAERKEALKGLRRPRHSQCRSRQLRSSTPRERRLSRPRNRPSSLSREQLTMGEWQKHGAAGESQTDGDKSRTWTIFSRYRSQTSMPSRNIIRIFAAVAPSAGLSAITINLEAYVRKPKPLPRGWCGGQEDHEREVQVRSGQPGRTHATLRGAPASLDSSLPLATPAG